MNSTNKTNLKEQLVWILDKWLEHQDDYEKLNFFFNYEFHGEELTDYIETRIIKKIHSLEKEYRKQKFTRQRYARDNFYTSDAWKEETHKVKNMKDEDRYKVHKVNF
jgi:hypothetical protein